MGINKYETLYILHQDKVDHTNGQGFAASFLITVFIFCLIIIFVPNKFAIFWF
jgi:hypothetical protein